MSVAQRLKNFRAQSQEHEDVSLEVINTMTLQGPESRNDSVWKGPQGQTFSPGVRQFPALDRLVCGDLRVQHQAGSPKVRPLCGTSLGVGSTRCGSNDSAQGKGDTKEDLDSHTEVNSQRVSESGHLGSRVGGRIRDDVVPCRIDRHAGGDGACAVREPSNEQPHGSTGNEHARGDPAPAEVDGQVRGVSHINMASECAAGVSTEGVTDSEMEFRSYNRVCRALIQKMMSEIHEVQQQLQSETSSSVKRLDLIEVMCSPESEVTQQVLQQGGSARRFGLSEGDLSQSNNRKNLFKVIIKHKPRHAWYSPVCGPWCSWSHLNQNKSIDGYHRIVTQRSEALWQISLAVVLYQLQMSHPMSFSHGTTTRFSALDA